MPGINGGPGFFFRQNASAAADYYAFIGSAFAGSAALQVRICSFVTHGLSMGLLFMRSGKPTF